MAELEYEIRVSGLVPATVLEEFEGVRVVVHPTTTVLRGTATALQVRPRLDHPLSGGNGQHDQHVDLHPGSDTPDPASRAQVSPGHSDQSGRSMRAGQFPTGVASRHRQVRPLDPVPLTQIRNGGPLPSRCPALIARRSPYRLHRAPGRRERPRRGNEPERRLLPPRLVRPAGTWSAGTVSRPPAGLRRPRSRFGAATGQGWTPATGRVATGRVDRAESLYDTHVRGSRLA
jgi:hypothetical protein